MRLKRVVIIGPGASGKSKFARQLGEITGLPVIELDKLFWQPGLVETPRDEWVELLHKLVGESEWIMDGDPASASISGSGYFAIDAKAVRSS